MDRFGLSWRGELAAEILADRSRIDCLEVIADDYTGRGAAKAGSLRMIARQIPVSLHSIQLGISSLEGLEAKRVDAVARLIDTVRPESWSEHLAFVRGGGIEIGHLAAAPRTASTVEATLANLDRVRKACGTAPAIENIATLIDPPLSAMTEPEWLASVLEGCDNPLLLDLHNVYSNATNFSIDPRQFLDALPLGRVSTIHIAGGKWLTPRQGSPRWLDDHKNPTPAGVYELLEYVASQAPQPLTVILERDGEFPAIEDLLAELDSARAAVRRGRSGPGVAPAAPACLPACLVDSQHLHVALHSGEQPAVHERLQALDSATADPASAVANSAAAGDAEAVPSNRREALAVPTFQVDAGQLPAALPGRERPVFGERLRALDSATANPASAVANVANSAAAGNAEAVPSNRRGALAAPTFEIDTEQLPAALRGRERPAFGERLRARDSVRANPASGPAANLAESAAAGDAEAVPSNRRGALAAPTFEIDTEQLPAALHSRERLAFGERLRALDSVRTTPDSRPAANLADSAATADTQALLARLYVDSEARRKFLAAPAFPVDVEGLHLAAHSFAKKRERAGH